MATIPTSSLLGSPEHLLATLVSAVRDYAIFALDPFGHVVTWNRGAELLKGYKAEEIIGSHFSRFYTNEDILQNYPQQKLDMAQKNGVYQEEGWRLRKDGSRFWASVLITALRDEQGVLLGFGKVTRDLTEWKKSEQLREREQTLDQIFDKSPSFMALVSVPDFRYIKTNAEHLNLIGRKNIIGKTVEEVLPEVVSQGIVDLLRKVVNTGEPFVGRDVPVRYEREDGGPAKNAYLDFVYQPLRRPSGEIYAVAAQGYDVTEKVLARRAVENERENFRNLFRQTPEMVCILKGPDHVFEFVNEAHVKALGFDATGMAVRVAQPESVEVHGILDEVYRTGKTAELHEIAVTLTDRVRYFNLTYAARRDEEGAINGIMILGVEVTDQVLSREALKTSQEQLARAVKSRDEFLSIASHELKTPLTSLKLQAQIRIRALQKGDLSRFHPDKLPKLFDSDSHQVDRLVQLVDDMLDISRIQRGKLEVRPEVFDLIAMVQDVIERHSGQIAASGSSVHFEPAAPVKVCWDRFRIEQVLANLLTNAIKYGAGSPIRVSAFQVGEEAGFSVADQGIGISEGDQGRIFEQFERAISYQSIAGLGLGLYISKKIVDAHGGAIKVESAPKKGAKFSVQIPLLPNLPFREVSLISAADSVSV